MNEPQKEPARNETIVLNVFTDPMMGLSYESQPILDRLQREYGEKIEIHYIMSLLVPDVSAFMLPEERAMAPEAGIRRYCQRLARIYRSEEAIGGLPIPMETCCLFDVKHRSSRPLNLAYKAAQLADPLRADAFLLALRHATVYACRPTTHWEEILKVVREEGIDEEAFTRCYQDGSAEAALEEDLAFTRRVGIPSLPSYLIQCADKALLLQSFYYEDFQRAIKKLTQNTL